MPDPSSPTSGAPKQRSGCLLAFYIALGLAVVCLAATGIGVWVFLRSETGQKVIKVASDSVTLIQEASQAPGTEALRAAGCTQALVIPTSEGIRLLDQIAPGAAKDIPSSLQDGTLVWCAIEASDAEGPDCAQVARLYAGAAPEAPDRFAVMVQHQRRREANCNGSYARDGTFLEPLEPLEPLESPTQR